MDFDWTVALWLLVGFRLWDMTQAINRLNEQVQALRHPDDD